MLKKPRRKQGLFSFFRSFMLFGLFLFQFAIRGASQLVFKTRTLAALAIEFAFAFAVPAEIHAGLARNRRNRRFVAVGRTAFRGFGTGTVFAQTDNFFAFSVSAQVPANSDIPLWRNFFTRRAVLIFTGRRFHGILNRIRGIKIHSVDENNKTGGRPDRENYQNGEQYFPVFHM